MNHKLALITGASSGLGKALAKLLSEKNIALILTGRNRESLEAMAQELGTNTAVSFYPLDLAQSSDRKELIRLMNERMPDLVVNNAGFGLYGDALLHPISVQLEMLEVNASAVLEISLEAASTWIHAKKRGTILNISSAAAFYPYPEFSVYAASKGFVLQFSQAFDEEVSPHGVRVLTACPGQISTSFRARASQNFSPKDNLFSMPVEKAAQHLMKQIEKKKQVYVFDWRYKLSTFIARHLVPKKLLEKMLRKSIHSRYQERKIL